MAVSPHTPWDERELPRLGGFRYSRKNTLRNTVVLIGRREFDGNVHGLILKSVLFFDEDWILEDLFMHEGCFLGNTRVDRTCSNSCGFPQHFLI
eukprot:COSAG02_NODE_187_length_30377_cov_3.636271_27_plen_94_part_00